MLSGQVCPSCASFSEPDVTVDVCSNLDDHSMTIFHTFNSGIQVVSPLSTILQWRLYVQSLLYRRLSGVGRLPGVSGGM